MSTAAASSVRTFQVDKSHSEVIFQVRHLITTVRGRFSDFAGTIAFDREDPTASTVEFTIQATSIDTNEPNRDTHLRSADFFAADIYPTIRFVSTRITPKRRLSAPPRTPPSRVIPTPYTPEMAAISSFA